MGVFIVVIGHLMGVFFSFVFVHRVVDASKGVLIALAIVAFIGFLEYQLFRSIKFGVIYWRGDIDEENSPSYFKLQQFLYSFLAGFIVIVALKQFQVV